MALKKSSILRKLHRNRNALRVEGYLLIYKWTSPVSYGGWTDYCGGWRGWKGGCPLYGANNENG